MKRTRYVAVIAWTEDSRREWRSRLRDYARISSARSILEHGSLLVVAIGPDVRMIGNNAVIIGPVFDRAGSPLTADLQDWAGHPQTMVVDKLVRNHWGGYVALLPGPRTGDVALFRAPMGDLPCYWTEMGDAILAGSDLTLMCAVGMPRPSLDGAGLAQYLGREDLLAERTCLDGLNEVRGGDLVPFARDGSQTRTVWSPWMFARPLGSGRDEDADDRKVRDAALSATRALAQPGERIVLRISGGLDSSILAACLNRSDRPCTALNLVTTDPSGDERDYARLVCAHLDIPLVEAYREANQVSVERSAASGLPRPSARSFSQEMARLSLEVAKEAGADVLFDGGGGDNIFCSLQSARPTADCLMAGASVRQFLRTAADIAQLAQVSLWQVALNAWSIRLRRSPAYRWSIDLRFLSIEARAHAEQMNEHPWLLSPPNMLPGKAAHVALIAAAQSVIEGRDAAEPVPAFSPLIVQPMVEACLAIPSWRWFEEGRNRAAARRAFADDLPEKTIRRRSKGAPDSFIAEIYQANRSIIREMLGDGLLSKLGLIDREAIIAALDDPMPLQGHDFLRVMRLADAEAWARCWS